MARLDEVNAKLELVRSLIPGGACRLRGSDWFAWATAGASNVVLLTSETGIAEILITPDEAWILTDEIEAQRLLEEELPGGYQVHACPWSELAERERKVTGVVKNIPVVSDRPLRTELLLPEMLIAAKRVLCAAEIERYREVGQLAAQAMHETLIRAQPEWSEHELSGAAAQALWARGLHPALTLAAGAARVQRYRHPSAQRAPLGAYAMLVFCARGYGLYANLTRFVAFEPLNEAMQQRHRDVAEIEASALDCCRPGTTLTDIYHTLERAYAANGYAEEIHKHHQGGTTGYLAREVIATPARFDRLVAGNAIALNPSLIGVKIEDTFVITGNGLENLTLSHWPTFECGSRLRPKVLERM